MVGPQGSPGIPGLPGLKGQKGDSGIDPGKEFTLARSRLKAPRVQALWVQCGKCPFSCCFLRRSPTLLLNLVSSVSAKFLGYIEPQGIPINTWVQTHKPFRCFWEVLSPGSLAETIQCEVPVQRGKGDYLCVGLITPVFTSMVCQLFFTYETQTKHSHLFKSQLCRSAKWFLCWA